MRVCTSVNNQCLNYFNQLLLTYLYSTGCEFTAGDRHGSLFTHAGTIAMALCLSVCVCILHKSVFYRNG